MIMRSFYGSKDKSYSFHPDVPEQNKKLINTVGQRNLHEKNRTDFLNFTQHRVVEREQNYPRILLVKKKKYYQRNFTSSEDGTVKATLRNQIL